MDKKIILIGAGGHGLVVAEIAKLNGYKEIFFLDDNIYKKYDYPIIGKIAEYKNFENYDFFVSIGNNQIRKKLLNRLIEGKQNIPILIHPSAILSSNVKIGLGTVIMPGTIINCNSQIGTGVIINTGVTIDHENIINDFVHISPGCHLSGQVTVKEGSWLGTGCNVINNITICEKSTIGAGSTIIHDILSPGIYIGTPVRRINK